jgi:hypothetical protein
MVLDQVRGLLKCFDKRRILDFVLATDDEFITSAGTHGVLLAARTWMGS